MLPKFKPGGVPAATMRGKVQTERGRLVVYNAGGNTATEEVSELGCNCCEIMEKVVTGPLKGELYQKMKFGSLVQFSTLIRTNYVLLVSDVRGRSKKRSASLGELRGH